MATDEGRGWRQTRGVDGDSSADGHSKIVTGIS